MTDQTPPTSPASEEGPDPATPRRKPPLRKARDLTPEEQERILELSRQGSSQREISQRTGIGRRIVRRILTLAAQPGLSAEEAEVQASAIVATAALVANEQASKLDPFREAIKERVEKELTTTRILREIRALGYTGGRSILGDYVRTLRPQARLKKRVFRRFETPPADELQFDWSTYTVPLGGQNRRVQAFSAVLCWSRKMHVRFYRDQRQGTLIQALAAALEEFGGVPRRVVFDGMTTAALCRVGADGKPVWNPRFKAFADHYGFDPFLCRPADPDRKGKDERPFWYLEEDFVRGSQWESLEHLNQEVRRWLDEVANVRVHRTTRRVPDQAWREEQPLLLAIPETRHPTYDEETRGVSPDSVISVKGTAYTVPASLAHLTVVVRLHAEHFEVLDPRTGQVALSREYVPEAEKGRLVIDPTHYASLPRRSSLGRARLEARLLERFPSLASLVDGLRLRFNSLAHVHLSRLTRLADRYGEEAFLRAATSIQELRRFDSLDVQRLLEREHPLPPEHDPVPPVGAAARALAVLGDVDPGSLEDYAALDDTSASKPAPEAEARDEGEVDHGA